MQFAQASHCLVERDVGRQVQDHRLDLGAQEMVRARRPFVGQGEVTLPGQEVEDGAAVVVVANLARIGAGETSQDREERCRSGVAFVIGERGIRGNRGTERVGPPVGVDVGLGGADYLE